MGCVWVGEVCGGMGEWAREGLAHRSRGTSCGRRKSTPRFLRGPEAALAGVWVEQDLGRAIVVAGRPSIQDDAEDTSAAQHHPARPDFRDAHGHDPLAQPLPSPELNDAACLCVSVSLRFLALGAAVQT